MSKKLYAAALLVLALGATLWWLTSPLKDSPRGTHVASSRPAAVPNAAMPPATAPQSPANASASQSATAALPRTWGPAKSVEGTPLDPRQLATAGVASQVAVGRIGLFEGGTISLADLKQDQEIIIPLPGGLETRGVINLKQAGADGAIRVGGGLRDGSGSFSLTEINGQVGGRVLLRSQGLAFLVSTIPTGEVMIREVPLAAVLCLPLAPAETPVAAPALAGLMAAPPELRSRPGAASVLFLDFDGATVTDPDWPAYAPDGVTITGPTIVASPANLNDAQITEVWHRVKEDFWPFNVNVTTVESDYTSAPVGRRMRVIITPTSSAAPAVGGIAYRDSFAAAGNHDFTPDIPCWVFNTSVSAIVETISHELGHTLGLSHDGLLAPNQLEYYTGHPQFGSLTWGPIMGSPVNAQITQWSKGEYPGANNQEDDLALLSGQQATALYGLTNQTGYMADDIGSSRETATAVDVSSYTLTTAGVINTNTDSDYFSFTVGSPRRLSFTATPSNTYNRHANLDVQLELQNAAGNVLMVVNPENALNANLVTSVPAGTYYLRVSGAGHAAPVPDNGDFGYSNYGSLGPYTVTGTLADVVAPSITSNPQPNSFYASQSVTFSASAIGTAPLVYQWMKDGNPVANSSRISGATSTSLSISNLTVGDAGNYVLTVSNGAGSVSTAPATLAVTMPGVPAFYYSPSNTTVVEGNSLNLSAYASSPVNITYQWYRDGFLLTNQTSSSLYISPSKPSDAGNYWLVATNVAGSATSGTAAVTITTATPPSITSQPQDAELFTGQYYTLWVNATSTGPLTFQWYRNGVVLPNATSSSYYISNASAGQAGLYTVTVTSPGGTVTSASAEITVSSTLPPRITSQPYSYNYASANSSASFSVSAEGTGPLVYRWYRNGVQVPNASSSSLYINPVTASDIGEYYVTVSNANGTVQSDTVMLDFSSSYVPESYWHETREVDGVIYFLFKNSAKIARYDLATETWLPAWNLIFAPTAFTVSADAVYVAFGTTIKKYSRSFTNETIFAYSPNSVIWLEAPGGALITATQPSYAYTSLTTYDTGTGAQIDTKQFVYSASQGFSYGAATGRVYGRTTSTSPGDIKSIPVSAAGVIGVESETPYHGSYPEGTRTFLLKDGTLISDTGGVVYDATDLTYRNSFGTLLKDATPAGTGYCVLTGTRLYRYDENFRQVGTVRIPVYGARAWVRGQTVYTFVQPTTASSQPMVHKTDLSLLVPEPPAPIASPYGRKIVPDQVVMDEDGVIYVYNKELRNVFRWSTASRRYLPAIPLVARPRYLAYSAANRALYFDNGATQVRRIALDGALTEDTFYNLPQQIQGLQAVGDNLMVMDPSGAWATHWILSPTGTLLDAEEWNYYSREYTWSPANNRLYFFRDDTSPNDLHFETISSAGLITDDGETPYHGGDFCGIL